MKIKEKTSSQNIKVNENEQLNLFRDLQSESDSYNDLEDIDENIREKDESYIDPME